MTELERTIDVYKTINKQLSLENNRLKEDLKEKRLQILELNNELQAVHASYALFKQSVTEVVANAAADFDTVQRLISRNAGNFSQLIDKVLESQTGKHRNTNSPSSTAAASSSSTSRATTVNMVKPMIRHPYGGFVQNLSIRIPRLNESEIRSEVAQEEEVELENTATSLYSEEEIETDAPPPPQQQQQYQPLRTAELQQRLQSLEPQPSTSYEGHQPYDDDRLRTIMEVTENVADEDDSFSSEDSSPPCTPPRFSVHARRVDDVANKENSSPLSMSGAVSSTPIPRNPQCAQIVLPRITNLQEFSEQNNVRILNDPAAAAAMDVEESDSSAASESTTKVTTRKRKKAITVMKRRSTERPKRLKRPAKGSLQEPSGRKKMRRSK